MVQPLEWLASADDDEFRIAARKLFEPLENRAASRCICHGKIEILQYVRLPDRLEAVGSQKRRAVGEIDSLIDVLKGCVHFLRSSGRVVDRALVLRLVADTPAQPVAEQTTVRK